MIGVHDSIRYTEYNSECFPSIVLAKNRFKTLQPVYNHPIHMIPDYPKTFFPELAEGVSSVVCNTPNTYASVTYMI